MSESMIKRVARVLCSFRGLNPDAEADSLRGKFYAWEAFIPQARAVIEALREPTEEMISAMCKPVGPGKSLLENDKAAARVYWHRMIDAALKDA